MFEKCPCGLGASYLTCCAPRHQGTKPAETAEALMRARYSAYAKGDRAYLIKTWHPSTRPLHLPASPFERWVGLVVEDAAETGPDEATVRFVATAEHGGKPQVIKELSRFVRENGIWFYIDGTLR